MSLLQSIFRLRSEATGLAFGCCPPSTSQDSVSWPQENMQEKMNSPQGTIKAEDPRCSALYAFNGAGLVKAQPLRSHSKCRFASRARKVHRLCRIGVQILDASIYVCGTCFVHSRCRIEAVYSSVFAIMLQPRILLST